MADPERLLQRAGRGSTLDQLLRAGAAEQPDGVALRRTLTAVGLGGALAGVAGGAQAAGAANASGGSGVVASTAGAGGSGAAVGKASAGALLLKWVGAGVLAGGVVTGAAHVATSPEQSKPAVPALVAPVSSSAVTQQRTVPPEQRPVAPIETTEPAASGRAAAPPPAAPEPGPSQLSAELAALGRAKALSVSNPVFALRELDSYRAKFPGGKLSYEASVLGMQTAERAGQRDAARSYAREVLAFQPVGPQADHARSLLEP